MLLVYKGRLARKQRKALAISSVEPRGSAPISGLMADSVSRKIMAFKRSSAWLLLLTAVLSVAAGNVEFKHHNNTEMAEILQQIHNR